MSVSRRALLGGGILALGAESSATGIWRRATEGGDRLISEVQAAPPPPRLTESELEDLLAFAEVLAEGRILAATERAAVAENIAERASRDRDSLDLYRATVNLLRRLAGRRFAGLAMPQRLDLVTRHRLNVSEASPESERGPFAEAARLVRGRARRDLIADYYNSPAGWAAVDYRVFPGRCGDLLRYTRPEP